jgi:hypothetical protein
MDGDKKNDDTNIFDLTALVGVQNEQELKKTVNTVTIDEQEKMLQDYEEIPSTDWSTITPSTHVRYLRKDGAFRRGGFVKNSWIGLYGTSKGKKCLQLSSTQSYKSAKWTICFDDIDKIWQKKIELTRFNEKNTISPEMCTTIQSNKESVEYLVRTVEQIKIDVSKINNEQTRIINLIKKLHNIKSTSRNKN